MSELSEKIRNLNETPYQKIAKDIGVCPEYVGKIARGERIPKRGKGLKVKKELEKINQELKESQNNI